ncbi:MAG: FecR domain-containing protein [Candidatus Neomarinimicrobiota bacterium]
MIKKHTAFNFFLFLLLSISSLRSDVIARLIKVEGKVYFKRLGMETFSEKAKPGAAIVNGDQIKIGDEGYAAVIYIDDRSIIKIKANTKFSFMDSPNTRTIDLVHGTLLNKINKEKRTKSFRIQTPVSVASVKGTEFAAIVSQKGIEQFVCKEGSFEVLNMISGQTVIVGPGQKAFSNSTGDLVQAVATPKDYPQDPEVEENIESELEEILESQDIEAQEQNAPPELEPDLEPKEEPQVENETQSGEQIPEDINQEEILENNQNPESEIPSPGAQAKPFSLGLGIGSATLDGVLYNQLALRPEINIWKIGIGLDLILYIDNEGNIAPVVQEKWDIKNDPSLILDKILYIRYGQKTEPGWFKYGSLESLTLGYGGLVNNYSNIMEFPSVRRVGVNGGFNIGPVSGELFLSNLKDIGRGGTFSGVRLSYKISKQLPISFGFNYVVDSNMFSSMKDTDGDTYPDIFDDFPNDSSMWNDTDGDGYPDPGNGISVPEDSIDIDANGNNILDENEEQLTLKARPFSLKDNEAKVSGFSFDVGYPIFKSKAFSLNIYSEFNSLSFPSVKNISRIERKGNGITIPGFSSTIFGILSLSLEYRLIKDSYIPQFFDQAYDLNRVVISTKTDTLSGSDSTIVQTKDMMVFGDYEVDDSGSSSSGLYGSAGLNLFDLVNFSASYTNMTQDSLEIKSFTAFLNLNTDNIPKINSAMAFYQRNNEPNPFDFKNASENTIMGYRIGYELSRGVSLIWDFRQYYRDDGTGVLKPIRQTTIETAFNF